jgi:2-polyprenyl-3-methyl-5-hydroxy-6-metoxy-1,4-benzoquinol methylase
VKACVHCRSTRFRPVAAGHGFDRPADRFDLVECLRCRLVVLSPLPSPADLERFHDDEYYGGGERKFNSVMEACVRWANDARAAELVGEWAPSTGSAAGGSAAGPSPPVGRVLDIGCGRGHLLKAMARRGWECYGTELSTFPMDSTPGPAGPGSVTFLKGAFETLPFEDRFFDLVSVWHVLEHTSDPGRTIEEVARTLKPGGILALAVPNYSSVQRMMFGRRWFHLDLPRHCYHFRKSLLLGWLGEHGLQPVKVRTFSAEQNLFGFVQSSLNLLFGWRWPNGFYRLLRHAGPERTGAASTVRRILAVAGYAAIAAPLFPLALAESAVSALAGRGATLIVYARRSASPVAGNGERKVP